VNEKEKGGGFTPSLYIFIRRYLTQPALE